MSSHNCLTSGDSAGSNLLQIFSFFNHHQQVTCSTSDAMHKGWLAWVKQVQFLDSGLGLQACMLASLPHTDTIYLIHHKRRGKKISLPVNMWDLIFHKTNMHVSYNNFSAFTGERRLPMSSGQTPKHFFVQMAKQLQWLSSPRVHEPSSCYTCQIGNT